jgi:hypothetical protein
LTYYDGPTSGAVQCAVSANAYRFEMLAIDADGAFDWDAWDQGQEIRIFGLAPLSSESFDQIEQLLSGFSPSEPLESDAEAAILSLLAEAGPAGIVLATHGIEGTILGAREVTADEMDTVRDWFFFMGLTKSSDTEQSP